MQLTLFVALGLGAGAGVGLHLYTTACIAGHRPGRPGRPPGRSSRSLLTLAGMVVVCSGLAGGLYEGYGASPELVRYGVLGGVLVASARIDAACGLIPNRLLGVGACTWLMVLPWLALPVLATLEAALASAGLLLVLREGSRLATGHPGMGLGDVKLAAVTALYLGWTNLWVFYLAALLGGVLGLAGLLAGHLHRRSRLPFAPFVAAATALHLLGIPWSFEAW